MVSLAALPDYSGCQSENRWGILMKIWKFRLAAGGLALSILVASGAAHAQDADVAALEARVAELEAMIEKLVEKKVAPAAKPAPAPSHFASQVVKRYCRPAQSWTSTKVRSQGVQVVPGSNSQASTSSPCTTAGSTQESSQSIPR